MVDYNDTNKQYTIIYCDGDRSIFQVSDQDDNMKSGGGDDDEEVEVFEIERQVKKMKKMKK